MKIKKVWGLYLILLLASCVFINTESANALNKSFYIDCDASTNGTGTLADPWNTPQSLYTYQRPPGAKALGGGDKIYLKRGSTCNSPLQLIRGRGVEGNPIIVSDYGDPTDPAPIVDGKQGNTDNWDGQSNSASIHIYDVDNLIIENLDIRNTGGNPNDSRRQGIQIFAVERYGAHENIIIRNNHIHDVLGEYKKNHEATAGILVEQRIPGWHGDPQPTWFENILIEDNVIEDINRMGINFWGDWNNRMEDGYNPTGPEFTAWTDVIVRNNIINRVRGDAIQISNTDGAQIYGNEVNGFNLVNGLPEAEILAIRTDAKTKQSLSNLPSRNHAGIWTYNADNTIIEHNIVKGGVSNHDGMAFDIDGGSVGTIIQYNYSENNEGGFALICGELGQIRDGIIRFNISKNDYFASLTVCVGEVLNTKVYNNTIYSENPVEYGWRQVDWLRFGGDTMTDTRQISIENNIFAYGDQEVNTFFMNEREGEGLVAGQVDTGTTIDNNVYFNIETPAQDNNSKNVNPLIYSTNGNDTGYKIRRNSPAYKTATNIAGNGGLDYFGNSLTTPYNIGAEQSSPAPLALWNVLLPNEDSNINIVDSFNNNVTSSGIEEPESSSIVNIGLTYTEHTVTKNIAEVKVDVSSNIDWSNITAGMDIDNYKVYAHNLATADGVVGGQFSLLLPYSDAKIIGVCPGADSTESISKNCSDYFELSISSPNVIKKSIGDSEYYVISGLTGTGVFYPEILGLANTGFTLTNSIAVGLTIGVLAAIISRNKKYRYFALTRHHLKI